MSLIEHTFSSCILEKKEGDGERELLSQHGWASCQPLRRVCARKDCLISFQWVSVLYRVMDTNHMHFLCCP